MESTEHGGQNRIVYLSHGGEKYHDQTRFSVLTLLARLFAQGRRDIGIVLYTDRPDLAPKHHLVSVVPLDPGDLARWHGPLDYVHRIKLIVLRQAARELGLPFIYVDSDTRWLKIPDEPFAKLQSAHSGQTDTRKAVFYMHAAEGEIAPNHFPQYFRFLHARGAEFGFDASERWIMWNSGSIGVPADAGPFFDDALELCDKFLPLVRYRNCVEQLVLSLLATSRFQILPIDDCVHHYWRFGTEAPVILRRFFSKLDPQLDIEQQASLCVQYEWDEAELRAIQNAPARRLRRWLKRGAASFHKRKIDLIALRQRYSGSPTKTTPGTR